MTIKTHGRMFTDNTVGITQLDIIDGTANQAIVTDGQGVMRFATVGAGGSVGSSVYVEDIRTGDGSTVTFTLSTAAPYEESILVFIDGVAQPTSAFTLPSTTSITFSPAPGNGAAIRICHLGIASSIADNSITGAKIAMGGDTPGDVLFYNGTDYQRLTIGTAGQHLATNSATNAPEWTTPATTGVANEEYIIPPDAATTPTTGVWTRPAGVTQIEVQVMGAAGGGGRNPQTGGTAKAGKGGDGGLVKRVIDVRDIATIDYSVGARGLGAGHVSAPTTAQAGQNASFGHNGTALSTGLTVTVVSGVITAITNPGAAGSGMTLAPLIFIEPNVKTVGTAAGGSGATAVATISGGAVTGITVTNGGTGYVQGSVIASFGLNAIGGLGGGNANSGTPGNSPSMGIGYGNKGNIKPWTMGTEGRTPSDPTDSTHGSTIREFGVGGAGGGPTSITPGGNGQHGGIYIRSYR